MASDLGVLVVHLHEEYQCSDRLGDSKNSIGDIRRVLWEAVRTQSPIIFTTLFRIPLFPPLYHGLPPHSYDHSAGNAINCFSGDLTLAERLRNKGIKRIILAGYNKYCCVYHTARAAVIEGFQFATGEDILFGTPKNQQNAKEINQFYHDYGTMYPRIQDLISGEFSQGDNP